MTSLGSTGSHEVRCTKPWVEKVMSGVYDLQASICGYGMCKMEGNGRFPYLALLDLVWTVHQWVLQRVHQRVHQWVLQQVFQLPILYHLKLKNTQKLKHFMWHGNKCQIVWLRVKVYILATLVEKKSVLYVGLKRKRSIAWSLNTPNISLDPLEHSSISIS